MNLYKNIFYISWESLINFEMNIMSMEYPNAFKHNVANVFIVYRTFLKT